VVGLIRYSSTVLRSTDKEALEEAGKEEEELIGASEPPFEEAVEDAGVFFAQAERQPIITKEIVTSKFFFIVFSFIAGMIPVMIQV